MIKQIIIFWILGVVTLSSCQKNEINFVDQYHPFDEELSTDTLQYEKIDDNDKQLILQLDESSSIVTNASLRSFRTDELIQIRAFNRDMIRVTSYSAVPIQNIQIYCRINNVGGLDEPFHLLTIDSLPAFGQLNYQPAFVRDRASYKTISGKYISFYQPHFGSDDLKFTVDSDMEITMDLQMDVYQNFIAT